MAQKSIENEALPSRNPCASPWCQPVETESSESGIKPEPVTALETSKFPLHESDASGGEFLETMRKLAVAAMLPRSELSPFDRNPLNYFIFMRTFENNV